ncbi:MAG: aspartate kinase, partial [Candidatus Eremiobacteraeota bacterium]|nr:aspartate kinase [Candidatus Eremiobacteraeota bacterium]
MTTARPRLHSIVVQKFGGSSLGSAAQRELAAVRVREALDCGNLPVVVVSAMGRLPQPYATDSLLRLIPEASAGPNRDLLLSCGEVIGASVFAQLLDSSGVPARALTGAQAGIITEERHGDACIIDVQPQVISAFLDQNVVPVVAGFQGVTPNGVVTTLGRGGSDLTAVALAAALGNVKLEIFTDVDGVMTADPRRVPDARTIPALDFEELTELAAHGAKVIHERAAELARRSKASFAVRGLRSGLGTLIGERPLPDAGHPVTGVATLLDYSFMHLSPEGAGMDGGWEQEVFRLLAGDGISLDCININAAGVFFIVKDAEAEAARRRLEPLAVALRLRPQCAKISI